MTVCNESLPLSPDSVNVDIYRIYFRAQDFFSGAFVVQVVVLIAVALLIIIGMTSRMYAMLSLWMVLGVLGAVVSIIGAASCLLRVITWRRQPLPIEFTRNGLRLPHSVGSNKVAELLYAEIQSLDIRNLLFGRVLVIAALRRAFVYPIAALAVPSPQVLAELAAGFQHFPLGRQCWKKYDSSRLLADILFKHRAVATYVLCGLVACVYGAEWFAGSADNIIHLITWGGNVPKWVREGELGRLFTASFLHLNFAHLYMNIIALIGLGAALERLIGIQKFLVIYLFSGFAGSLATALFSDALMSVGASGAIFGVLGALAYVTLRLPGRLPPGFRQTPVWWGAIASINVALPFLIPAIDWRAHVGGFIAGAFAAGFLLGRVAIPGSDAAGEGVEETIHQWREWRRVDQWLLAALVMLYSIAVILVYLDYPTREQKVERLFTDLRENSNISEPIVNLVAWSIVLEPLSSASHLKLATEMMEPGIAAIMDGGSTLSDRNKAAHLDTYASLLFLQGKYRRATILERRALMYRYTRFFASQYSRFLQAYFQQKGIMLIGDVVSEDVQLSIESADDNHTTVKLARVNNTKAPLAVAVSVANGATRVGYFLCQFDALNELMLVSDNSLFNQPMSNIRFTVQMIDAENMNVASNDLCRMSRVDGYDSIPGR